MALMTSCQNSDINLIEKSKFNSDNEKYNGIELYALENSNGLVTQITNYGGRVVSLWVPDKNGNFEDIVLGFDNIEGYKNSNEKYFGALIGRYGNRIQNGQFKIDKMTYNLATNNGENHLHGGPKGFHEVVWSANQIDGQTLELSYFSKDGEVGYPGNLNVKVQYTLSDQDELKIEYWAETDKTTHVNLTHHSFFNLKGAGNGVINDHVMEINADYYTPVDAGLIPNGKISSVKNTPMDFLKPTRIGERVNSNFEQINYGLGYDHNWVLNQSESDLNFAAKVTEPESGRSISVFTNEPGLQFYGGNFLDGSDVGKNAKSYNHRTAFCLETSIFQIVQTLKVFLQRNSKKEMNIIPSVFISFQLNNFHMIYFRVVYISRILLFVLTFTVNLNAQPPSSGLVAYFNFDNLEDDNLVSASEP